jgi:hypothetical protein
MKLKLIIFLILIYLGSLAGFSQELYQEGKTKHIDLNNISYAKSINGDSSFNLGGLFRFRLRNKFDVGFLFDYTSQYMDTFTQSLHGKSLTMGTVFGYTSILTKSGWGIRSSLALRLTFSNLSRTAGSNGLSLAGYGADSEVLFFRCIKLTKSIRLFPGIGVYTNLTHFMGSTQDKYALSRIYVPQIRETYEKTAGTPFSSGLIFQIPVSFRIFGNKDLSLNPSYWFNSYDSVNGINGSFRMSLRFSF